MWPPPLSEEPLEFEVKPRTEGKRLDVYLSNRFTDYSRRVIQKIIDADAVLVNGRVVKASYRVRPGDLVSIRLPDLPDTTPKPEDIPIEVVYEDEVPDRRQQARVDGDTSRPGVTGKERWSMRSSFTSTHSRRLPAKIGPGSSIVSTATPPVY